MNIILAHRQLDFDALASMVAAQKLYPDSVMVLDGKANQYVQDFLALAKDSLPLRRSQDVDLEEISGVILVDTHDLRRTGSIGAKIADLPEVKLQVFDHHPYSGELRSDWSIEAVGACTTLLVEKLAEIGFPLNSFEATLLALGIYDDTGSLLFESTTVRDVKAVAYLLEQGAHLDVVADYLRKPLTLEQKELLQQILDNGNIEFFKGTSVFLSYAKTNEYVGGLALIAHRIGELERTETWFLVVQMENRIYLVARSRGKGLTVNQIVEAFGGSGHPRAASATIKGADVSAVLVTLREEISNRARHPYTARDMMTFPVKFISPDTKMLEAEQILLRYGHTGVPVINDDRKLVGIISRRDIEKAIKHGLEHAPVKGFMTTTVITAEPDDSWDKIQSIMVNHDIGRVPVVEDGKVLGIVSRSDVLRIMHGSAVPIETELARERSAAISQDILDLIEQLSPEKCSMLDIIRDTADQEKCPVYIVGGFVRDLLLLVPTQDIDLVVEGSGLNFAQALVKRLDQAELTLHSQFGTARILFKDGTHLDIASTRWEFYAFPGALPQVEESCLRDDLFRRDFTINAMAISLNSDHYGELVDYYGGLRDLKQGEIRFLHNLSFIDDPTRILRAVRFGKRYHFQLAKEMLVALETAMTMGVLHKLSFERFTEELMLIYMENNYQAMLSYLDELGVFKEWFKEEYPWNFDQRSYSESKEWPLEKRWLCSLIHMTNEQILRLVNNLRLTKNLRSITIDYIDLKNLLNNIFLEDIGYLDEVIRNSELWMIEILAADNRYHEPLIKYLQALNKMKMEVNGKYLRDIGVAEGPELGKLLKKVRQAWLKGEINSTIEEQEFVHRLVELDI